ncbi:MAG: STAS domain-containing protein [Gemmatimonadetes bacterium]|nr:STAS domain-containing protein [Gemmatimonadota bacterium]
MNSQRIHVSDRFQDGTVVVSVSGDPVANPDAANLRNKITDLVDSGARTVVVDFSHVNRVGAAMLGELATGLKTARNAGGDLRLSGVSRRIRKALELTRLSRFFKYADAGSCTTETAARNVKKVA